MRFISKSANLNVILSPGLPAQPIVGIPAKPTVFVRFEGGVADIEDHELAQKMLAHPGFNRDFISAEDTGGADPFAYLRKGQRGPEQVTTELKYGTPGRKGDPSPIKDLPPGALKAIQEMAVSMAKEMAPVMAKEMLKSVLRQHQDNKSANTDPHQEADAPTKSSDVVMTSDTVSVGVTTPPFPQRGRPRKNS